MITECDICDERIQMYTEGRMTFKELAFHLKSCHRTQLETEIDVVGRMESFGIDLPGITRFNLP